MILSHDSDDYDGSFDEGGRHVGDDDGGGDGDDDHDHDGDGEFFEGNVMKHLLETKSLFFISVLGCVKWQYLSETHNK